MLRVQGLGFRAWSFGLGLKAWRLRFRAYKVKLYMSVSSSCGLQFEERELWGDPTQLKKGNSLHNYGADVLKSVQLFLFGVGGSTGPRKYTYKPYLPSVMPMAN